MMGAQDVAILVGIAIGAIVGQLAGIWFLMREASREERKPTAEERHGR